MRPLPRLVLLVALLGACDGDLVPMEPVRTVRVVAGPAALVGSEGTGCSYGVAPAGPNGPAPDRWCAFYRKTPDGSATELWAVNLAGALRAGSTEACDGASPGCRLLSATLWTGDPIFSPAHPWVHGFEGDTLVFYADSASARSDEAFVGPIRGWRPGLAAARVLTGSRGSVCVGHLRSDGVLCIENQATMAGAIEFDLGAGALLTGSGPLSKLERVRPYDNKGALLWQVAFSPAGEHLAFSTQAPDAPLERLRIVETAQIGTSAPREIARDVARWQFSPDGKRLFFLRGYQYASDRDATGTLAVADFPGMTNPTDLATRVSRYQVQGPPGSATLGVSLFQDVADTYGNFRIMPDISKPTEMVTVAQMIEDARVSPDRRFTFFYDFDTMGDTISVLARNDGGGRCILNANPGQTAFGVVFAGTGQTVFWGEDSVADPANNEGRFANPMDCTPKQTFSSRLAYLEGTRSGALFGDEEATPLTMHLRHARLQAATGQLAIDEVATGTDTTVALIDQRYVVYTVNQGDPASFGLYVHGPLP